MDIEVVRTEHWVHAMTRNIEERDVDEVLTLAKELAMFDSQGMVHIQHTLDRYFKGGSEGKWLVAEHHGIIGVVYCTPEVMTQGTWNILMLMVSPNLHGRGIGYQLISDTERILLNQNGRLLIVETSGMDGFVPARAFYPKCGFKEEARIRDFYQHGDDKIVFTKHLNHSI